LVGGIYLKIFLGAELEGAAGSRWFALRADISKRLSPIQDRDYGSELVSIAIISIIMKEETIQDGAYKERKYYNRKEKYADIRLQINYKDFLKARDSDRREMYISHILKSVQIACEKAGDSLNSNQLINDIKELLINTDGSLCCEK
jgi:hypothetical protein